MEAVDNSHVLEEIRQYCGFIVDGDLYAVPVLEVQEVIRPMKVTSVPLADGCIRGLMNLRGQIVTLVSLRRLFDLPEKEGDSYMNVIVRVGDSLAALMVDEIRDVIEVGNESYESTPDTLNESLKRYVSGVYKLENQLMTVVDAEKIVGSLT